MKYLVFITALCLAVPSYAQPTPEPKAPATMAAPKAEPASAPAVVEPKVEEKAEPTPAAPVEAPEAEEGLSLGKLALKHLLELVFSLVGLLLSGLIVVLLRKFGFEAQKAKVEDVLEKAKGYAEQWALKKVKLDAEAKPGMPEKMSEAVCFAKKLAAEYKLPEKGSDWWEEKLESWLGVKNGK